MTEPTEPIDPPSPGGSRVRRFWRRRSWKGKTGIIVGLIFAAFVLIGVLAPAPEESSGDGDGSAAVPTRAQTITPQPTTEARTTTEAQTTTQQETVETEEPEDTGRLSEGEYATFQRVQAEVVDESLQFSEEFQACSVIGQSGDLAGFRECVQSGYSGFEEDADSALFTARDLLDHTDKRCRAALNSYAIVLADYAATVKTAYEVANRLDVDAMTPAFNRLPREAKRYRKFARNALRACAP